MLKLYQTINSPLLVIGVLTLSIPLFILAIAFIRAKRQATEARGEFPGAQKASPLTKPVAEFATNEFCQIEFGQVVWHTPKHSGRRR